MSASTATMERNRHQDQAHLRWLDQAAKTVPTYPRFSAFDAAALIVGDANAVLPGSLACVPDIREKRRGLSHHLSQAWRNTAPDQYIIAQDGKFHGSVTAWRITSPPSAGAEQEARSDRNLHQRARQWAQARGLTTNPRGRVRREVLQAYLEDAGLEALPEPEKKRTDEVKTQPEKPQTVSLTELAPLAFEQASSLVSPETASALLAVADRTADEARVQTHIDSLRRTVAGTYSPLECLVLLDPVGRPLVGMELLEACSRTGSAVRALLVETGTPARAEASQPGRNEPAREEPDEGNSAALLHAVDVINALDAADGAVERLTATHRSRVRPVEATVLRRARALLEQGSLKGPEFGSGPAAVLDPVFVDALRLLLAKQVGREETEVIDGQYALLFQALDHGLAEEPTLKAMIEILADPTTTRDGAVRAVLAAWPNNESTDWIDLARETVKYSDIRTSAEDLATALQMREEGKSARAIGRRIGRTHGTVQHMFAAVEETRAQRERIRQ